MIRGAKPPPGSRNVLDECIRLGVLETFVDDAGDERVRLTPLGFRSLGISEAEIAEIAAKEAADGRPYSDEQLRAGRQP